MTNGSGLPSHGRRRASLRCVLTIAFVIGAFLHSLPQAHGHGDVHLQIVALTAQIETNGPTAELYLRRGDLHRLHQGWDEALADFDRAHAIEPTLDAVDFSRGRLFLEAGWPWSAKWMLDRYLARHTNHVEAWVTRGRVYHRLGYYRESIRDYTRAIGVSAESRPELFIERAQANAALGADGAAEALRGLDEGIQKLGPLVTLQLQAIEIELQNRQVDGALARLDKMTAVSPRKETWLTRRGDILRDAGRLDDARKAYEDALTALDTLPPVRRNVPAMQELEKRIRTGLAQTTKTPAGK